MLTYTNEEIGGRRVWRFTWKNCPIAYAAYRALFSYFWKSAEYAPLTQTARRKIKSKITQINKEFGSSINIYQALSIHHLTLKAKIIKSHYRMNAVIATIAAAYKSGQDILKLAAANDFPPLNLLRGILLHLGGYSAAQIYDIFANKADPDELSAHDRAQFARATRADADSVISQQEIARRAQINEDLFVDYFRKLGVGLRTQEQLVEMQTLEHGRAVITPDLLFLDQVYINDAPIHWIDFKSYTGTDITFIYESNIKQAARYTREWGPGAVCYQLGFVENLTFNGAISLDGEALTDVKFTNDLYFI